MFFFVVFFNLHLSDIEEFQYCQKTFKADKRFRQVVEVSEFQFSILAICWLLEYHKMTLFWNVIIFVYKKEHMVCYTLLNKVYECSVKYLDIEFI